MSKIPNRLPAGTLLHARMYRIVRFIAAGGFGCTYEAEHVLLEKRVAIKEFFMQDYCNRDTETNHVTVGTACMNEVVEKYKRKFIGEAKALSGLRHEGIVSVSDVFEENGTAYFVMEYVDGQSLAGLCKSGPLPEKHALYYIRQVCEALAYVHDHNRLHLDLKPGNIMVEPSGRIVLIDFGASKQYDAASGENTTTLLGYTPGYAPLEQMNRNVQQFFPATDIYALGATLYCLLTGHTPQSPADRLNDEESLAFPDGISAATRHAVERAMELRKKDRPQSVREFMAQLDTAVNPAYEVGQASGQKVQSCQELAAPAVWAEPIPQPTRYFRKHQFLFKKLFGNTQAEVWQVGPASGSHNGSNFVDLGLSVKWATMNVGADALNDFGDYFAWGETKAKEKYEQSTCMTHNLNLGDIRGNASYDAARSNWGGSWRLPTEAECEELLNHCSREWGTLNGVAGVLFTSKKNGNSIFFPAAGWRGGTSACSVGASGYYWLSTPHRSRTQRACCLYFGLGDGAFVDYGRYICGMSVRPVLE